MKVLYLLPQPKCPDRIGAYTFLDEEIQGLAAAGIEAYVLSRQVKTDAFCGTVRLKAARLSEVNPFTVAAFLARHAGDVPFRNLSNPWSLYHAGRMEHLAADFVRQERIDLIHSHFAWPEGFGGLLARATTGRPLVASLRGTDVLIDMSLGHGRRLEPAYDRAVRRLLRSADRTICFSRFMRDHVVSLGVSPERARVVSKGVDLSQFRPVPDHDRPEIKARLGLPAGPLILSVGGLIPLKGVHLTLQALGRLRGNHEFSFVVCGDGPELDRLRQMAEQLGLAASVHFMGAVDRSIIADYFSACDFLVHASFVEAAGNVLLEAMASGRPVICARAGGPQEYVDDGRTGYVVDTGDVESLTNRIAALLEDPDRANEMGAEGLRRARTMYAFPRMIQDIVGVYEEALAGGGRAFQRPGYRHGP